MISLIYPDAPGAKLAGTSTDAATAVAQDAQRLRDECLSLLRTRDLTADECAEILKQSVLSVRPRFSELKAKRQIFDSGVRRKNKSGHSATVWSSKNPINK